MSEETPTIGQKLQEARNAKGMTIDDVQQKTKIQRRYLIAIEDGKFDELPGDFYVRAFIKQYAQAVDLDGDEVLQEYNDQLPRTAATNVMPTSEAPTTREKAPKIRESNGTMDRLRSILPIALVSLLVLVILGAIWVFAVRNGNKSSNNSQISSSSVKVSSSSESSSTESSSSSSSSSSVSSSSASSNSSSSSSKDAKKNSKAKLVSVTSTGANSTYRLENAPAENKITISADSAASWMQVTPAGSSALYVGTMQSGKSQTVTLPNGATSVAVSFGNRSASKIEINGKSVDISKGTGNTGVLTIQLQAATSAAK